MRRRFGAAVWIVVLATTACATQDGAPDTTVPPATTSTTVAMTTTTPPVSTTTTPPTALEELGYPVSDDWVVETVVAGIDAGTGGLAVAADGTMYQADFGSRTRQGNKLYRVLPDGTVEDFVTVDDWQALTMTTIGPDGALYQSDFGGDQVYRVTLDGTTEPVGDEIEGPTGIVFLDNGDMLVESFGFSIIYRIAPDGTTTEFTRYPRFNGINGMTRGPDGTVYVVNFRDGGLFAVDAEGAVTDLHHFPADTAHVAYLDGSLFVTSRGALVVYRYDLETGYVEIIAGNAEAGDQDGRGSAASFGRPNAITASPDGALYINHGGGPTSNIPVTIRRIVHDPR